MRFSTRKCTAPCTDCPTELNLSYAVHPLHSLPNRVKRRCKGASAIDRYATVCGPEAEKATV